MRPAGMLAWLVVLGLVITVGMAPAAADDADDARVAQSQAELERVRARLRALANEVESDRNRRDDLYQQLRASETRISELVGTLSKLERDIADQQAEIGQTRTDRNQALTDMAAHREVLREQIRAAYQMGRAERTKLLLNQEDPAALGRVLTYYDHMARARSQRIQDFARAARALASLESELQSKVAQLESLYARRKRSLDAVEATRAKREQAVTRLEERIRDSQLAMRELQADEAELTRLIASLQDLLADIPVNLGDGEPITGRKGELTWPLRGTVLAAYGAPKAGSLRWKGLWIAADAGTDIRAVAAGRVAYVGWMHRFGLMVVLEHDDGWYTLYGHTQSAYRQIGEWVRAGEPIATAGNSGGHRQAGVYFEMRRGQQPVDPIVWLAAR